MNNHYGDAFRRDGFVSGIRLLDTAAASQHRQQLERAEREHGELHYKPKAHTLMCSPWQLATLPQALDVVEQCIGPDILLLNVTYIIKEAGSASHVSWHQDLTYWGLSDDTQVSMWLALSDATELSGCMQMIPGSHQGGRLQHETTEDQDNVLLQGQTVRHIDEQHAVLLPLTAGEASFHHGWTLHASMPNNSNDRRIGLNVQYIAPHVRQTKHDLDTAILVRGEDRYQHYGEDKPATTDFDPDAVRHHAEVQALYYETVGS